MNKFWWLSRNHAGDICLPKAMTLFNDPGDDPGDTGGDTDDPPGDNGFTPPDLSSPAAKAWFEQQTAGLAKKNRELLDSHKKTQKELRQLQERIAPLGDLDKASEIFKHAKSEEEKRLLEAGKFEEVINRRANEFKAPLEQELEKLRQQDAANRERITELTIDRVAAEAAAKAGVHKESLKVVKMLARETFKVGEDGSVGARDGDGLTRMGKDGKPLTPETWIDVLREDHPYLFPGSGGGGAAGGPGAKTGGNVIRLREGYTQREFDAAMDKAEKEGVKVVMPGAKE